MTEEQTAGTIKPGEYHPSADAAMDWLREYLIANFEQAAMMRESLASCAIEGNRLAEICSETFNRIDTGQPVSDRYLLGLCWFLRDRLEDK